VTIWILIPGVRILTLGERVSAIEFVCEGVILKSIVLIPRLNPK
jgi:hypothetical protein